MKVTEQECPRNHRVPPVEGGSLPVGGTLPAARRQRQPQTVWWGTTYTAGRSGGRTHAGSS